MTIRFSEGVEFMRREDLPQPITIRGLWVDLRVTRESDDVKAAAVRGWLNDNVPNVNLRESIRKSGLFTAEELRSLLAA